jgi:hypothetical protein
VDPIELIAHRIFLKSKENSMSIGQHRKRSTNNSTKDILTKIAVPRTSPAAQNAQTLRHDEPTTSPNNPFYLLGSHISRHAAHPLLQEEPLDDIENFPQATIRRSYAPPILVYNPPAGQPFFAKTSAATFTSQPDVAIPALAPPARTPILPQRSQADVVNQTKTPILLQRSQADVANQARTPILPQHSTTPPETLPQSIFFTKEELCSYNWLD